MDDTLSIGDIVCLYSEESLGFVYSSQTSTLHSEIAVGSRQDRVRPEIPDQHIVSFEVCVANRYKLNKKYRKLQSKSDEDPENLSLKNSVAQAKIAAQAEEEDNALEQKRQLGKKVLYGQVIQLRHLFTGKYVHVSTTKTSQTESNNMAVDLLNGNAKHAQFRIMPRYKVKAEGDVVQIDDQIVLDSIKSSGQFLHVSRILLGVTSVYHNSALTKVSESYELNLSVRQSGFTVYRKYKPSTEDENKVKVGDLVRFYHKEMEAYLVAEGLFNDELTEDVHLRMRPIDQANPKTMFPSSSAVTYWQIELQEGPITGGVLKWEQQCRIIHMCTRKYLTVNDKSQVTLTSDYLDPNTVFRLHAVIRLMDSDDIPFESYCRIEHVVTGHWLHALTEEYMWKQRAKLKEDKDNSMGALKYSTAQLKKQQSGTKMKIEAIREKQYDDAFTLQAVDTELVDIFHYMAGMVPFIQKLVKDKKEDVILNAKSAHTVIMALSEMKQFMVVDSVPNKRRQKLMRNLRIVELLVSLLQIPYRGKDDRAHLTNIFVEAYDVLYTYLMGDSRKNELYIAKYIDFFLTQFEYKEGKIGLNAAHMVMELIRDNRKIVDRITHEHIDKFIDLLRTDKNYRYLDLLSVLCVCDGVSIADNQKYITEVWLMRQDKSYSNSTKGNCYLTDLGEKIQKDRGIVYVSTNNGRLWEKLRDFASESAEEKYLFLEHQLELFGMLCHGQNDFAIDVITNKLNYLTWEEAFTCLCDESLPDRLRAKYCELIITLFVDIGDNISVVDRVKLSYIYDDIDQTEGVKKSKKDTYDKSGSPTYKYFPKLRDWISHFLGTNGDMTASEVGNNLLVEQVLCLVHFLVKYGFYHKSADIEKLLVPLMSLLDGRNDKPYPNMRGKEAEEVLKYFKKIERFKRSPETKAIVDAKIQALEVLNLFFNFIFNLRMEKFMNMFKVTHQQSVHPSMPQPELWPLLNESFQLEGNHSVSKSALKKLKEIFDETAFFKNYEMTEILLDLSHYEYDEIVRKSMHLLNRYFSAHHNLFSRAVQAQVLITDKSVDIVRQLEKLLPTLRRLATAKLSMEQTEELSAYIDILTGMCHLEGETEENHMMNQNVLYNHGVLEDCLTILSQEIDVKLLDQYGGLRQVFKKTFTLLKFMARNNKQVQGRLFDRLEMLLSKDGAPAELADCITEVFTGNSNTCMKIYSHQVQKIMGLVARHRSRVPQFLDLLNAIVKVEELDLPLKRNQSYVMTYFMQHRSDIATVIDQSESEREKILVSSASEELNYLIAMVDLLATCAEGENRFIESICQTIFKIPDLLKVLNNNMINNNLKRPFLRFLLWVYMNTASGMIESGAGDLPHDRNLWAYLDSLNGTLKKATDYATANPDLVKQLLKRPPAKSTTGRIQTAKGERSRSAAEEMRGSLHYLFDAVMPFLQVFCRSYFQPDTCPFPEEAKEPERLSTLTKSLEAFLDAVAPHISIQRQMKLLINAMTSIITASGAISVNKMEEFHEKYGGGLGSQDVRSEARKRYEDYFDGEEDINTKLNVFAVNMHLAYGGVNDVQTQIGFPSREEYSEIGGDEELPLGIEFQEHLRCFIDPHARTPEAKYRMAEKLVKQLFISATLNNLSEKEKIEQTELDEKCLQLLRGLIHNEIIKLPLDWELNTKSNKRQLKVIESVQFALNSYNVIESTLNHLSRPQDNIIRELLAFLAALLFGGNQAVQMSLIAYFTGTREETFFFAIKNRMQLSSIATREKRLLHAMHTAKVEEMVAQTKALQKAMKAGNMKGMDLMMANQLGSMLSLAKNSMVNLRNPMGSRGSMKRPISRASRMSGGKGGNTLMIPQGLGPPKVAVNGSMMNGVSGPPPTKMEVSKVKSKKKSEVAPLDEVDIKIEDMDEEELTALTNAAISMSDELDFKDDGFIELVLRVLGLMCDNQHKGLQNYLREQPDNIKSVNLVAETTRFLNILYSSISDKTAPLLVQLFDTLVEYTSGNFQNQSIVFDNKICEYINHILRVGVYKNCPLEQVYTLKKSIATLIKSLTEENPPEKDDEEDILASSYARTVPDLSSNYTRPTPQLFHNFARPYSATQLLSSDIRFRRPTCWEVMEYLDRDSIVQAMVVAYGDIKDTSAMHVREKTTETAQLANLVSDVGFAYYHILCRMMDLHEEITKPMLIKTPESEIAWTYFYNNTLSIEVLKEDILQKIYFHVKDKNVLREEIKEKFKYDVDRSSPSNKLRDFMDWSQDIIADIKYQRKVHANPLARFFVQSWPWVNILVMIVTVAIAFLVMITWHENPANAADAVPQTDKWPGAYYMTFILGGIHNILSLMILISYFLSNHPTFPGIKDFKRLWKRITPKRSHAKEENEDEEQKKGGHLEVKFFGFLTFYYICFLGFSVSGTALYGYFFSVHLLHMAMLNQLLKRVIQAVTRNGWSLVLVALLGIAIMYIFSLISFAFYRNVLTAAEGRHCRTIYECLTTMIHHGLIEGVYNVMEPSLAGRDYHFHLGVTVFDTVFFILITTIGLNIIFGIIVDTFSELRDNKWQIDNDMKSNCFICSRESYDFERQAGGFEKHVKMEHNQWAYLFFFIHLDETRPNDYTALELYIANLLEQNNFDFFPLNRAMSLRHEEDSNEKKLETLMDQVDYLVNKMKEEEATKEREKEKQRQKEWEAKFKADKK
ncbi:inositol 1,4,5-trisphosphate-gated calcium channel ITPR2-like [Haliotis asinina]|uniref:inositol 1,4,5-trisphosphate-gated calcium channel ITPR2-like n=1 Tax=Haliotis asinina TaxID=109174 RepID=UPI0035318AFD